MLESNQPHGLLVHLTVVSATKHNCPFACTTSDTGLSHQNTTKYHYSPERWYHLKVCGETRTRTGNGTCSNFKEYRTPLPLFQRMPISPPPQFKKGCTIFTDNTPRTHKHKIKTRQNKKFLSS